MKLLLLEDDLVLNKSIRNFLKMYDFQVLSFMDGDMAIDAIDNSIDIYLLDINVEGSSGLEVLKAIRIVDEDVPVIIISANLEIETIMGSYASGCNEYLKKPFDVRELKLKIEHLLSKQQKNIVLGEGLEFDAKHNTLLYENKSISLTKKELLLLKSLVKQKRFVVEYDVLMDVVWADEAAYASMDALRTIIARLRSKLPYKIIKGHIGIGYSLEI